MIEDLFDGVNWNRGALVELHHARAAAEAERRGWPLHERSLLSVPLSAEFVTEFEDRHRVVLPAEYRSFLTQVGDGGDGPGLYMRQLGAPMNDSTQWDEGTIYVGEDDPNHLLHVNFAYTDKRLIDPRSASFQATAGALYLFDHGDAMWDLLVVSGPSRGQIWQDRLTDSLGLSPALDTSGERVGFADHYCAWLCGH